MTSKTLKIQRVANGWVVTDDALDPTYPVAHLSDVRVAMTAGDLVDVVEHWAKVLTEEPNTETLKKEGGRY